MVVPVFVVGLKGLAEVLMFGEIPEERGRVAKSPANVTRPLTFTFKQGGT
jgi:hypothetical protein